MNKFGMALRDLLLKLSPNIRKINLIMELMSDLTIEFLMV